MRHFVFFSQYLERVIRNVKEIVVLTVYKKKVWPNDAYEFIVLGLSEAYQGCWAVALIAVGVSGLNIVEPIRRSWIEFE